MKCDHTEVVEHPDDDSLEVDVGDLASLLPQHVHFVIGQVQIGLQIPGKKFQFDKSVDLILPGHKNKSEEDSNSN